MTDHGHDLGSARPTPGIPTQAQLAWQRWGLGFFYHFGINTFADLEWSDGTVPAVAFNPTALDVDGWLDLAVDAGARYAVLTAKHHDGFCLWPTATTDYSVRSSPWNDGHGDVVAEFVRACRERDVAVGLYLSPWDRNCAFYPDPERYSRFYTEQLSELCTRYGELAELWFDGAGSDGYQYDWDEILAVVREHQPQALVFNMGDPTIRWVGNEDGLAADVTPYDVEVTPGSQYTATVNELADSRYLPPEADVSVRPGWFWHPDEQPKSLQHLLAISYRSIGWGANLLLNVPPNTAGTIDQADQDRVREWAAQWQRRLDSLVETPVEPIGTSSWRLPLHGTPVDHLALAEDLSHGQQIFTHRVLTDAGELVAQGGTIGSLRLHAFPELSTEHLVVETDGGQLSSARAGRTGVTRREDLPDGFEAPTQAPPL